MARRADPDLAGYLDPVLPAAGRSCGPEEDGQARILAAGTLHLHITDFVRELTTIRVEGPHPAAGMERFGRFFAGQLWDVYGPDRSHA